MTESNLLSGDRSWTGALHPPNHSGLELGLDRNWITVLILARANVENGEDACDGNPQGCVCHETARTDAARAGPSRNTQEKNHVRTHRRP